MQAYHDAEWGVPQHDSRMLWEMLMLEGFQAGLSWITVLRKREAFRKAFAGFDPAQVARFNEQDIERLMLDAGIIRARAKIEATIRGAQIYLEMQKQGESFDDFRAHIQRDEAPRLQVCRPHHCVCLDAGGGHRGRPRPRLLQAPLVNQTKQCLPIRNQLFTFRSNGEQITRCEGLLFSWFDYFRTCDESLANGRAQAIH
jgi:hypothetical protein